MTAARLLIAPEKKTRFEMETVKKSKHQNTAEMVTVGTKQLPKHTGKEKTNALCDALLLSIPPKHIHNK